MGPNAGNGVGGLEMGPMMQGNGSNIPQATEYTLQGVMRFLQTEWHRHERDRNSWEIEKQEMKGRIANLEGQARRADATQRVLRKYVTMLERKVKEQTAQLQGQEAVDAETAAKNDRAAKIQEKLRCEQCPFLSTFLILTLFQLLWRICPYPVSMALTMRSSTEVTRKLNDKILRRSLTNANPNLCTL